MAKKNREGLPLHLPGDPVELRQKLQMLEKMDVNVRRTTKYQIKIGKYNYYWTTGNITVDGCEKPPGKGFEELIYLIERQQNASELVFSMIGLQESD